MWARVSPSPKTNRPVCLSFPEAGLGRPAAGGIGSGRLGAQVAAEQGQTGPQKEAWPCRLPVWLGAV